MTDDRGNAAGRSDRGRPGSRGNRAERGSGSGKPGGREDRGRSGGRPSGKGSTDRPARSQGGRSPRPGQDRRSRTDRTESRTETQQRYDGPPLPEEITGRELDRSVSAQLKGLPDKLALRVARHLAAAQQLIDDDPETAYQHTLAARARAGRLAIVREAVGEAAYAAGHYAEALAELRAAKRMNGATAYLPMMADCQRALGRPQDALKLAKSPSVANFPPEAKAEMTLVEAGARRDLGQFDAALRVLELSPLTSQSRAAWVVRLRYGYADTLEAAGRESEALAWFHRTHAIDGDEITDAAERAEQLEQRLD
jgi:tetratricopeptide (TPR) repeat protein